MVEDVKGMAIDELIRVYDEEGPFELIDGKQRPMSPPVAGHGSAASILFLALGNHVNANGLGIVFLEIPFVLEDVSGWVKGSRVPDIMFYSDVRFNTYQVAVPDWKSKPVILVPYLVVEIISPTDRYSDVQGKIELYLHDGVKVIWVLDPQRSSITIYAQNSKQQITLSAEDSLDGGDIIPGFNIPVADIFA